MKTQRKTTMVVVLSIVLAALLLLASLGCCAAVPRTAEAADAQVSLDSETLARYRYISQAEIVPQQYQFEDLSYTVDKAKDITDKLNALESASKALTALKFASKITAAVIPNPTVKVFLERLPSFFESTKRLFINSYIFETGHMTQDNFTMMSEQLSDLYSSLYTNLQQQTDAIVSQMRDMQNYIVNTLKREDYGKTINEFLNGANASFGTGNVGYYAWKADLLAKYARVDEELEAEKLIESNLEIAFEDLYNSASMLDNLFNAIIPQQNGSPTDYSILDVMYDYYLLSSDESGADLSKLNANIQSCIELSEDVYNTYMLANTYLSLCYQYVLEKMGGVDDNGNVDRTHEYYMLGDTQISFSLNIRPYLANCEANMEKLSGFISNYYARLTNLDQIYYLKTGDFTQRLLHHEITSKPAPNSTRLSDTAYEAYLNVNDRVPQGSQIIMPTLPVELIYQLRGNYKFSINDNKLNLATVSDDGIVTVTGDSGSFDVLLTQGDSGTVVYTQHFEIGSSTFMGGGTPNFPYLIQNTEQLSMVANNSTYWGERYSFRLANDITLNSSMSTIGTADNPFKGSFDGGNHSIKGLRTNALFGTNSGTVSNLTIEDANVTNSYKFYASAAIGILANENNGTITNCHVANSTVSCSHNYSYASGSNYTNTHLYIGGLVGENYNRIANCSVTGTTVDGYLTNSLYNGGGAPEADKGFAGGLAGRSAGSVSDCLSTSNTIKLKIHSVSYYVNIGWSIFTVSEQEYHCTAYFIRGGLIGEASGSLVRSIAYGNNLPTLAWSYDTAQASGNGKRTKFFQAVDNSMGNKNLVGNNVAQSQGCYDQDDLPSECPSDYANHGWNWINGKPTNNTSAVKEVSVLTMPYKTIYKVGDSFNPAGLSLQTDLNQVVSEGYDISGFNSSKDKRNGYVDVTASWKQHDAQFQIYVTCPHNDVTATDEKEDRNLREGILHTVVCNECGETLLEVWESTGVKIHHWDGGQVIDEPTCEEDGTKQYTCTDDGCNETYTEPIPATGHQWVVSDTTAPTCEHDGKKEYTCSKCGEKKEEAVSRTGHDYKAQTTQPATCEEDGYIEYECTHEGCETPTKRDTLHKLGHDFKVDNTKPATCTKAGYDEYKCVRPNCDTPEYSYQEPIPALGHNPILSEEESLPATCTKTGYNVYRCAREDCDDPDYFQKEETPALGHDYQKNEVQSYDANCYKEGLTVLQCTRCSDIQRRTEPITPHQELIEHPRKSPTYTEDGNVAYWYCEVCHKYFKDSAALEQFTDSSWLLPKYGLKRKFTDEMANLDKNSMESIAGVLETYYELTLTEREEVAENFGELQQAINDYNNKVNKVNNAQTAATKSVGALLGEIASGFIALAALLSVLKMQI